MGEKNQIPDSVYAMIRNHAFDGIFDGHVNARNRAYINACSFVHGHTGTLIIFTRDVGHHSSGWMKNPDYERCIHLSLSFREPQPNWPIDRIAKIHALAQFGAALAFAPFSMKAATPWVERLLYPDAALSWMESPFTPEGKEAGVRHWRLFCDEAWQPIKPRGEVYSTQFTELGWRSWSELNQPMPSHVDAD